MSTHPCLPTPVYLITRPGKHSSHSLGSQALVISSRNALAAALRHTTERWQVIGRARQYGRRDRDWRDRERDCEPFQAMIHVPQLVAKSEEVARGYLLQLVDAVLEGP